MTVDAFEEEEEIEDDDEELELQTAKRDVVPSHVCLKPQKKIPILECFYSV